jgi:hypothetical protein
MSANIDGEEVRHYIIRRNAQFADKIIAAEIVAYTDNELKIRTVIAGSVKQTVGRYDETLGRHVNLSGGVRAFLDSICSGLEQPWSFRDVPVFW